MGADLLVDDVEITGLHDAMARMKMYRHHVYSCMVDPVEGKATLKVTMGLLGSVAVAVMRYISGSTREKCLSRVGVEWERALTLFGPSRNLTEALGVLDEEIDELWDLVKLKSPDPTEVMEEATQIAAMAVRFLVTMDAVGVAPPTR